MARGVKGATKQPQTPFWNDENVGTLLSLFNDKSARPHKFDRKQFARDVAAAVGTSASAVSKYINDSGLRPHIDRLTADKGGHKKTIDAGGVAKESSLGLDRAGEGASDVFGVYVGQRLPPSVRRKEVPAEIKSDPPPQARQTPRYEAPSDPDVDELKTFRELYRERREKRSINHTPHK